MTSQSKSATLKATVELLGKYRGICASRLDELEPVINDTSFEHLAWLCTLAIDNQHNYPIDKLSRLLGFVQGVLVMRGAVTVQIERDESRKLFHHAYTQENIAIPITEYRKKQT